jgi:hypothetical protein
MSTIKISQLNSISPIDSNTSNTILVGVNLVTDITGKISATDLAGRLYWNNPLIVGSNPILFPNTIAQFSGNSVTYLQANFQNFTSSGSADVVLTSDVGTNSNNYIDLGINNSQFSDPNYSSMYPLDGYLYVSGPNSLSHTGNLVIGTASYGSNIVFIAGGTQSGNIVATFNEDVLILNNPSVINQPGIRGDNGNFNALTVNNYGNGYSLLVNDQTTDTSPFSIDQNGNTAIGSLTSYGYTFYVSGNTFFAGNVATSGVITLADGSNPASNSFVRSNDTITLASAKSYTDTANTWLQANDTITLASAKSYTDTANTFIQNNYVANTSNVNLKNLNISGNITISGTTQTASINTGNLSIVGTSQVSGNSIVYGSFTANGTSTLVGNVSMSGTSIVYGSFTANGTSSLIGNMSVSGTGGVSGYFTVNNSTFPANTALVKLTASNNFATVLPTNQDYMLQITGKDGAPTRVILDSFGNGGTANSYPVIAGRSAQGNAAFPTLTQSGDVLMRIGGNGYGNTGFQGTGYARVDLTALDNFSDATKGTYIALYTTPIGSNVISQTANFSSNNISFSQNAAIFVSNTIHYTANVNNANVIQTGTKANAVYANGRTGQITTVNTNINKGAATSFTVYNTYVTSSKDVIILNIASGASVGYAICVNSVTSGSFNVVINNCDGTPSGSNAADTLVINFAIINVT